jgi:hypothetical protein
MAKTNQNRGQEEREFPAPPPVPPAPQQQEEKRKPWRQIVLCIKGCSVYLGGALTKMFGGDWVTDQGHVSVLLRDPQHFMVVDVQSPEDQERILELHRARIEEARKLLAGFGMVILGDGSFTPVKR